MTTMSNPGDKDIVALVHKAQPVGDQQIKTGTIYTNVELPDVEYTGTLMQEDAESIADVLWETLPGGTLDRLVAEMLRRHASILIVRHQRLPTTPDTAPDQERLAQMAAHRVCHAAEHDPLNGKIHGCCMVCGVPWPCVYAGVSPAERSK